MQIKVKFTLQQAMKAQRGVQVQLYSSFNLGARWGWMVNTMPQPLNAGKDLVPIVQEAGWALGSIWTGAENLAPTRIQSPDCPAHSKSLAHIYVTKVQ